MPSGFGVDLDDGLIDKAKNGLKDITARSIGKVAEAKARKQRRTQRAITKLKKKAPSWMPMMLVRGVLSS